MNVTKRNAVPRHHAARLNQMIQAALLIGLVLSMLLMLIGTVLYFLQKPAQGTMSLSLHSALSGLTAGNPIAFMVLGMLVLMITPAFRVLVAALGYMLEQDWKFALVSLGVVAILTVSVLVGSA